MFATSCKKIVYQTMQELQNGEFQRHFNKIYIFLKSMLIGPGFFLSLNSFPQINDVFIIYQQNTPNAEASYGLIIDVHHIL